MNLKLYIREAESLLENDLVEEAESLLLGVLYEEPSAAEIHNYLGWLYLYRMENLEKAEMHLRYAILFNREFAPAYIHLAGLLIRTMRYSAAAEIASRGAEIRSDLTISLIELLGNAFEAQYRFREAIRHYRRGVMLSMDNWDSERLLGDIRRCRKKRLLNLVGVL